MLMSAMRSAAQAAVTALDVLGGPRLSILIFHRVTPQADELFPGEMHAARFDALCAALAQHFQVLTLGQAVRAREQGLLPRRALVITFDDGYADNATVALPILLRHGLRATFFVATGFLDGGRMWNDTVIELVRRSSRTAVDLHALDLQSLPLGDVNQRRAVIDKVLPLVKYMGLDQRQAVLDELNNVLGGPQLPDDLMMSSDQVRELHRAGMEIGGHTVDHPILRVLADADARRQIEAGGDQLRAITGAPVEVFAYPNGGPDRDYDLRHVRMVREAGFLAAVSTATGVVGARADLMQLPRFSPWDIDTQRFLLRLLGRRLGGTGHRRATLAG